MEIYKVSIWACQYPAWRVDAGHVPWNKLWHMWMTPACLHLQCLPPVTHHQCQLFPLAILCGWATFLPDPVALSSDLKTMVNIAFMFYIFISPSEIYCQELFLNENGCLLSQEEANYCTFQILSAIPWKFLICFISTISFYKTGLPILLVALMEYWKIYVWLQYRNITVL